MSTIRTIVERADLLRENALPIEMKVEWISELDGLIALEVLKLDTSEMAQFRYNPETDMETQPLVRFPHDNIYHYWLCAKIDAENGEYKRYQNSMQLYNGAFVAFRTWFSRVYDVYNGDRKDPGFYLSAYALAVSRGFAGDLDAWLQSLVGQVGPQGPMGPIGQLPEVTEADNGSVLGVVGGAWVVNPELATQVKSLADNLSGVNDSVTAMGTDVQALKEAVADLQYVPVTVTGVACKPSVAEKGSSVSGIVVSWVLNKKPVAQTFDGSAVDVDVNSATVPTAVTDSRSFQVTATDERGKVASGSAGIKFYNGVYYGMLADGVAIDSAAIRTLDKSVQGTRNVTFSISPTKPMRIAYAIPASGYGTPTFKGSNGFEVDMYRLEEPIQFTNALGYSEPYYVWLSTYLQEQGSTIVVT